MESSESTIVQATSSNGNAADPEINAIAAVASILEKLPPESRVRVVRWTTDRYLGATPRAASPVASREMPEPDANSSDDFPDVASLFVAANPTTGPEKALVMGFWLQVKQGQDDWDGFAVNSELKNLGHGLKNVTDALDALIAQRPQLAIQTRKSGKSKQARKKYRLTLEGIKKVRQMLSAARAGEPQA